MSDGIWDGTDRSKPVRCNYPNPYDPALPCRGILGHSGLHHFGQIRWPDADRVVSTTFTLAEVKAMGWNPPGSLVVSAETVAEINRLWSVAEGHTERIMAEAGLDASNYWRGRADALATVFLLLGVKEEK